VVGRCRRFRGRQHRADGAFRAVRRCSGTQALARKSQSDRLLDSNQRRTFLVMLAERFGPDRGKLDRAIETYRANPDARTILNLHKAAEPRRQEVIRRLNLAPCGTEALVRIRSYGER
jgi:malonyl-CoA decarboxylase